MFETNLVNHNPMRYFVNYEVFEIFNLSQSWIFDEQVSEYYELLSEMTSDLGRSQRKKRNPIRNSVILYLFYNQLLARVYKEELSFLTNL